MRELPWDGGMPSISHSIAMLHGLDFGMIIAPSWSQIGQSEESIIIDVPIGRQWTPGCFNNIVSNGACATVVCNTPNTASKNSRHYFPVRYMAYLSATTASRCCCNLPLLPPGFSAFVVAFQATMTLLPECQGSESIDATFTPPILTRLPLLLLNNVS